VRACWGTLRAGCRHGLTEKQKVCKVYCDKQAHRLTGRQSGRLQIWLVKKRKVWRESATQAHVMQRCRLFADGQTDRWIDRLTLHLADGIVAESSQIQMKDCFPADAQTDSQQTLPTKKTTRWMMYAWMMF
jgi:hypothetical protein